MREKGRRDNKGRILRQGEVQRKDLTYMYRWTDRNGNRQCIYAANLNSLREEEKEIKQQSMQGIIRKKVTLNQQIEIYLKIKTSLANSTKENYRYYYQHDIKESWLGKMQVADIKKSDILLFYKEKHEQGYKNGTIHVLHKIIHPALNLAVDDFVIIKNPSTGCMKEYPEISEEKFALTFEEEEEFLQRILLRPRMKRYYPFYAIMLYTGLRISEIIGLTWDDVDMDKREININHQLHYRKIDGKVKFYCSDSTKTKSGIRTIPMTDKVYKLFREQKKEWFRIDKELKYEIDGYSGFVFLSHVTGRPLYHVGVRRQMNSLVAMNDEREIQLPHLSPHILRHTACTRYAEAGIDLKTIQYLIGHTDLKTTIKIYNHVDTERAKRELKKYEEWQKSYTNSTPNLHQFSVKI